MDNFEPFASYEVEYASARVKKWRSSRTGLKLVYIEQAAAETKAQIVVATKVDDDSGIPHVLERLIFTGSKKYPFTNYFSSLCHRLFASTYAYALIDRTIFYLDTPGWDCLQQLLPFMMDHILNPSLTREAFQAEVYHCDEQGKESGIIFKELQSWEENDWDLLGDELRLNLLTKSSGFTSKKRGTSDTLRKLSINRVREFYKATYRPDNMCVIITGTVDQRDLLQLMTSLDKELPPLPEVFFSSQRGEQDILIFRSRDIIREISIPACVRGGSLVIGWTTPLQTCHLERVAIGLISQYFTYMPELDAEKGIFEFRIPQLTSVQDLEDIYHGHAFIAWHIPVEALEEVARSMKDLLQQHSEEQSFNLQYMREFISRERQFTLSSADVSSAMEVEAQRWLFESSLEADSGIHSPTLSDLDLLMSWSAFQWCEIIQRHFVSEKSVTIIGRPSSTVKKEVDVRSNPIDEGTSSVSENHKASESQDSLQASREKLIVAIPEEIVTNLGAIDVDSFQFSQSASYIVGENQKATGAVHQGDSFYDNIKAEAPLLFPAQVYIEDFDSPLITAKLVFSTSPVSERFLAYLPLLEHLFSLPIQSANEEIIPSQIFTKELEKELIDYGVELGFNRSRLEVVTITAKFESRRYSKVIDLLLLVLKCASFEEAELRNVATNCLERIASESRSFRMLTSIIDRAIYSDLSLRNNGSLLSVESLYRSLLSRIEGGNYSEVLSDINECREQLFSVENMKMFLIGGCSRLDKPVSPWANFIENLKSNSRSRKKKAFKITPPSRLRTEVGHSVFGLASIATRPTVCFSSFMALTRIPDDYSNPEIAPIVLAGQVISDMAVSFGKIPRGEITSIMANVGTGFLEMRLSFEEIPEKWAGIKALVLDLISGKISFDAKLEEAKHDIIVHDLLSKRSTPEEAALHKIADTHLNNRGPNHATRLLAALMTVTPRDAIRIFEKYFIPLFDPSRSLVFVTSPEELGPSFNDFLSKVGYDVSVQNLSPDD